MNYIKHLTGFFNKSNQDATISTTHISLYLALFQRWNLNRFKNPIIISRDEIMNTSKIRSKGTYHKCMKDLHNRQYIIYIPSYSPLEGTEVVLPDLSALAIIHAVETTSSNFDHSNAQNCLKKNATSSNFERTILPNEQAFSSASPKSEQLPKKLPLLQKTSSNFEHSNSTNKKTTKNRTSQPVTSSFLEKTTPTNELVSPFTSSNFEQTLPPNELVNFLTSPKTEQLPYKTVANIPVTTNDLSSYPPIELANPLTIPINELLPQKKAKNKPTSPNFEPTVPLNELVNSETRSNFERTVSKNGQHNGQVYIYNNKTYTNNIKHIDMPIEKKIEKKEIKKEGFFPPSLELITQFFQEKKISPIEAEKYFNYYSSKGWLVGNKTPMKDWQAAARNWILNLTKFNNSSNNLNPKNLNVPNDKDYSEPL